jgi:type IV pilus assembly protein PilW
MSDSRWNEMHAMKPTRRARPIALMSGFSLIELMISLTIGLVIVAAAMSAYLGSSRASKVSDAQSRMGEDAQAALSTLAQQVRMAGTNPVQSGRADVFRHNPVFNPMYLGGSVTNYTTTSFTVSPGTYTMSAFAIRGCDGAFSNVTTATSTNALDACTGTSTLADSIAVHFEADKYNTIGSGTSTWGSDCVGSDTPVASRVSVSSTATTPTLATTTFSIVNNRFYIANNGSVPNLYCKGSNSATQPLIENIEDMQILYGTVSTTDPSPTATVAGYLTAAGVVALAPTADTAGYSTAWGKVLTVRICVVVRSESPVVNTTAEGAYAKCDGTLDTTKTDLRLRRAYTTTVVLRNRRY